MLLHLYRATRKRERMVSSLRQDRGSRRHLSIPYELAHGRHERDEDRELIRVLNTRRVQAGLDKPLHLLFEEHPLGTADRRAVNIGNLYSDTLVRPNSPCAKDAPLRPRKWPMASVANPAREDGMVTRWGKTW
jgi:hypothetical protein